MDLLIAFLIIGVIISTYCIGFMHGCEHTINDLKKVRRRK